MGRTDKTPRPKVELKGKPAATEARQIWLAWRDYPAQRKASLIYALKERMNNVRA